MSPTGSTTATVLTKPNGEMKIIRNGLHAFGASNPFSLAFIAIAITVLVEHFLPFH
jgi:hypothetical protein